MDQPNIRKPWQRDRVVNDMNYGESVTDTSLGNDTDVNKIVARFARTGTLPETPHTGQGQYADVCGLQGDLTDMINKKTEALAELKTLQAEEQKQKNQQINQKLQELETLKQQQKESEQAAETPPATD